MPFLSALDEQILNGWASKLTQGQIARELQIKPCRVQSAISRARCLSDSRAVRRQASPGSPVVLPPPPPPPPSKYATRFYRAAIPCWSTHETTMIRVSLPRLKFLEVT